jgi:GINS complex subunit 2
VARSRLQTFRRHKLTRRNYGIASSTGVDPCRDRLLVRDGACDRHPASATRSAGTPGRTRTPPRPNDFTQSPGDNRLTIAKGPLRPLNPPQRSDIPLWLALLLKRQRRANILPPPWLNTHSLSAILDHETEHADTFSPPPRLAPPLSDSTQPVSPPFLPTSTADAAPDALPYHWLELGEMLLEAAADDFEEPDQVRKLLRGLREVRMAKLRSGVEVLDAAGGIKMNGVGGMEVGEGRSFITGVIDGLRYAISWQGVAVMGADNNTGRLELHANNNARIATPRRQRTAILAPQETTTTTRWTCNERASPQKPCNLTAYCIITADPHLQHQRLKIAGLVHVT